MRTHWVTMKGYECYRHHGWYHNITGHPFFAYRTYLSIPHVPVWGCGGEGNFGLVYGRAKHHLLAHYWHYVWKRTIWRQKSTKQVYKQFLTIFGRRWVAVVACRVTVWGHESDIGYLDNVCCLWDAFVCWMGGCRGRYWKKPIHQPCFVIFGHGWVAMLTFGSFVRGQGGGGYCGWCHEMVGHFLLAHDKSFVWKEGLWGLRSRNLFFSFFPIFGPGWVVVVAHEVTALDC
jgi:hypothetical protein